MGDRERLIKHVQDTQRDIEVERERHKPSRDTLIERDCTEVIPSMDFWCDQCEEDWTIPGFRADATMGDTLYVTIRAYCPTCDAELIRYVTQKREDPYYQRSKKILRQRNQYIRDVLQGGDYGFRTLYGDPFDAFHKRIIEDEEHAMENFRRSGLRSASREEIDRYQRLFVDQQ